MIRYVITYLTLMCSCVRLLADESLTQAYSCYASMTGLVLSRPSKKLVRQIEVDKIAEFDNLISSHSPYVTVRELTKEEFDGAKELATKNLVVKPMHNCDSRPWHDKTGCSVVTAEYVALEMLNLALQGVDATTTQVASLRLPNKTANRMPPRNTRAATTYLKRVSPCDTRHATRSHV